ncbi:hypothetical protein WDW89_26120 [Deltaproteobacteria bacterium TL4]
MKLLNKTLLTGLATLWGVSLANAETCLDKDENKVCFNGYIAGGLQSSSSDIGGVSESTTATPTITELNTIITLKPNEGWTPSARFKWAGSNGMTEYRVWANKGGFTLFAGRGKIEDVAGIGALGKGNNYTTLLGNLSVATYDQLLLDNDNLAFEYKFSDTLLLRAGVSDTMSVETKSVATSATNPKGEYHVESEKQAFGMFLGMEAGTMQLAAEVEMANYGDASLVPDADVPAGTPIENLDSGTHVGLGIQIGISNLTPFLNVDSYHDGTNTVTGVNLGVDLKLTEKSGLSVGVESYNSGVSGSDAQTSVCLGVIAGLFGDTNLGVQVYNNSSGGDTSTQVTLEFNTYF